MQRLRHLGFATIAMWGLSFFVSLSMMWHREWMEGDPPSEIAVGSLHFAAVLLGVGLGAALLVPRVRRSLSWTQSASFGIACGLAALSISSFLKN